MKATCVFSAIGSGASGNVAARAPLAALPSSVESPAAPPTAPSWAHLDGFSFGPGDAGYFGDDMPAAPAGLGIAANPGDMDWLAFEAVAASSVTLAAGRDGAGPSSSVDHDQPTPEASSSSCTATATATAFQSEAGQPTCRSRLAKLHIEIDIARSTLPLPPFLHVAADASLATHLAEMAPTINSKEFVERLLGAIQRLMDLYPEAVDEAFACQDPPPGPCRVPSCVHLQELPPELANLSDTLEPKNDVDVTLASQLVTCHLGLLDIVDRLAVYAVSCVKVTLAAAQTPRPDFELPMLKVGSFTPVGRSAQLIHIVLLKDLMDRLHMCYKLLANAAGVRAAKNSSLETRMLGLQVELLGQRQARALRQFKSIGSYLVNQDMNEVEVQ